MKVKTPYTWKQAASCKFNKDAVRRDGKRFRRGRLTCVLEKTNDAHIVECREWFAENKVEHYSMFALFNKDSDQVYYEGLVFDFKNEDDAMWFKLRFGG